MEYRFVTVILQCLALVILGMGAGLAANATSSTGIAVGRNHFAKAPRATKAPRASDAGPSDTGPAPTAAGESQDISPEGFRFPDHDEIVSLFQDPAYLEERYIFIDARDDAHYAEAHIPGAFQLDHYRLERYIEDLLPLCRNAEKIVVYCNGGKCEDSKLAATDLIEQGISPQKVFVYTGGVAEWRRDGLPFETGERLSEDIIYLEPEE